MLSGWLITRGLILLLLATVQSRVIGDVTYYWHKLRELPSAGLRATFLEYPTPVVWFLSLPYVIAPSLRNYRIAFAALMVLLDGIFTWALWRTNGRRRDAGIDFWLVFVLLIGALSYARFDLLPAVLVGAAVLTARSRPAVAGALTGLGAAIKLWPALLVPALAAPRRGRGRLLTGFVVVGIGLAVLSLITGGAKRLISPLTWQSGRGLQIESLWATPLMAAHAVDPGRWEIKFSAYQAFELFGPGVPAFLVLSTVATVAGLGVLVLLWLRAYRNPNPSALAVGLLLLATIGIVVAINKTLSPQYLLWLGGGAAALLSTSSRRTGQLRSIRHLAVQLLVLAGLTQLVYPVLYNEIRGLDGRELLLVGTAVLVLRNLALLIFILSVCTLAWRALTPTASVSTRGGSPAHRPPELDTPPAADVLLAPDSAGSHHRVRRS